MFISRSDAATNCAVSLGSEQSPGNSGRGGDCLRGRSALGRQKSSRSIFLNESERQLIHTSRWVLRLSRMVVKSTMIALDERSSAFGWWRVTHGRAAAE